MEAAITAEDSIITAYRCHGFVYTRGEKVESIVGELMGHDIGCAKAKGIFLSSNYLFNSNFFFLIDFFK